MRPQRIVIGTMVLGVAMSLAVTASTVQQPDQHDHSAPTGRVGAVYFGTSCAPAV
jgi:hypothetical protein